MRASAPWARSVSGECVKGGGRAWVVWAEDAGGGVAVAVAMVGDVDVVRL